MTATAAPASRRAILAGLAALPAAGLLSGAAAAQWSAAPVDAKRSLLRNGPAKARKAFVFFPGANCAAARYAWLGALATQDTAIYIYDPAPTPPLTIVTIGQVLTALDAIRPNHKVLLGGGHSAGASALLDSLDPVSAQASPRDHFDATYRPPQDIAGVAVMGCSLQAHVLGMTMTYRSEDRPLTRPHDAPLYFISGDHDLIAPPVLMEKTQARFAPPTDLVVLPGATHYGWTEGHADTDRADYNAPGGVSPAAQQATTVERLSVWMGFA